MRTPPVPRPSAVRRLVATGTAVLVASAALAAPAVAGPGGSASPDPTQINGYRSVGYVMSDVPERRDFHIVDLVRSGAIDDITHLNYAFGNVTTDLVCDILDEPGEGDAYNDFLRQVPASQSVDGRADQPGQALAGNVNQMRKLKEVSPDTKILISLGGWTWSDNFSDAALTPESRERLVTSCLDLYIGGDLPQIDGKGGPGVAAGIFDGIDVDWEWPVTGGEDPSRARPEDRENFLALMEEFRRQLDERGAADGEDYLLTAFAPAGGWNAGQGGWLDPRLFAVVDFLNVQGYDFHGGWVPNQTGHQGNLHPDGDHNWGLGLDGAMGMYVDAGARPDQLNAGLAAYGHGWYGVEVGDRGWQPAEGYVGTLTYDELKDFGTTFYDPEIGAAWRYDGDQWWTLDEPESITAKAEWLAVEGYGGAMWWDLSGDSRNELGSVLGDTLRLARPGPGVDASCAAPWYATGVYTAGDVVSHEGVEYRAKWWTRGQEPGASVHGPWHEVGPCGTTPPVETPECGAAWVADRVYTAGDVVSRAGVNHTAQWWTRGELPGSTPWGAWDAGVPCG